VQFILIPGDEMKKIFYAFWVLVLFSLLIFDSSCKKNEEILQTPQGIFVINNGLSKVMYFHYEDLTYLVMTGSVLSQNEIGGTITSWKFIFRSGDTELLEINKANYSTYLLYNYGQSVLFAYNSAAINVSYADKAHENFSPYPGKLFSSNPDNMVIAITIADDNGNIQTLERIIAVTFDAY
jgi:hypothetical protein